MFSSYSIRSVLRDRISTDASENLCDWLRLQPASCDSEHEFVVSCSSTATATASSARYCGRRLSAVSRSRTPPTDQASPTSCFRWRQPLSSCPESTSVESKQWISKTTNCPLVRGTDGPVSLKWESRGELFGSASARQTYARGKISVLVCPPI